MSWQWQTSPSGMQEEVVDCGLQLFPWGLAQTPRPRALSKIWQLTSPSPGSGHEFGAPTVLPPQQSESLRQVSPWMRQPPAGWQTVELVLPNKPQ
jgi:hypothetical protein